MQSDFLHFTPSFEDLEGKFYILLLYFLTELQSQNETYLYVLFNWWILKDVVNGFHEYNKKQINVQKSEILP